MFGVVQKLQISPGSYKYTIVMLIGPENKGKFTQINQNCHTFYGNSYFELIFKKLVEYLI